MAETKTAVRYTYADYQALPDDGPRYELIGGELIMAAAPLTRHQIILVNLLVILDGYVRSRRSGRVLCAPIDVHLSDHDVVQPDIVFISAAHADRIVRVGIEGPPDLCVEILSEGTRKLDLDRKRRLYAEHGAGEYWVFDPDADTATVWRLREDAVKPAATFTRTDTMTSAMFPGLEIRLGEVFER